MTPKINISPYRQLSIPELSGGVNQRDGISLIQDNQLIDCSNVWYKNALLKTRTGIKHINNPTFDIDTADNGILKVYADEKNFRVIGGKTYFLVAFQYSDKIVFRYYSNNGRLEVTTIRDIPKSDFHCNIFQHNTDIYCFCSGYYENEETPFYIFKIIESGTDNAVPSWYYVSVWERDLQYIPEIVINGNCFGYKTDPNDTIKGDMIEGFNLLGGKYKAICSTVYKKALGQGLKEDAAAHPMTYSIPYVAYAKKYIPSELSVTITKKGIEYPHTATLYNGDLPENSTIFTEKEPLSDGLKMIVECKDNGIIHFHFEDSNGAEEMVTEADYELNNMVIIAPYRNTPENYEKVLNMTFSEWYGGGAEGLYGGVHLFMGGNLSNEDKSLVIWSDPNKPLYFSEYMYNYVGDKGQAVTAFGKQGEALIVLKEREIYATKYNDTSVTNAENIINQSVVDIASASVTFPFSQVHGFIGCDCPNTVQLCRNRLVWAHSEGKVYTLVSANQFNERAIFEVSAMVGKSLISADKKDLISATSADWEGLYLLSVGNKIFLMDYNSYGYSAITSYSKNEDAQLRIPWWIWDMPYSFKSLVSIGGNLCAIAIINDKLPAVFSFEGENDSILTLNGDLIEEIKEIPTRIQTKVFDFGIPTVKKSVPKIELSLGVNGGVPITFTLTTEGTIEENLIELSEPDVDMRSPSYFVNKLIRPINQRAFRYGIGLESLGNMSIDALFIQFRTLGGIK